LVFLVDTEGTESSGSENDFCRKVSEHLDSILKESEATAGLRADQLLRLQTLFCSASSEPEHIESIRASLVASVSPSSLEALPQLLSEAWSEWLQSEEPVPLLSPLQKESLYRVEVAYTAGLAAADGLLAQWQRRVAGGRTVGHFADRLSQLLAALRKDFEARTTGSAVVRERAERLRLLQEHVGSQALRLHRQQLALLETRAAAQLRRDLLAILREAPSAQSLEGDAQALAESAALQKEQQEQALRRTLFHFQAAAAELEGPELLQLEEGQGAPLQVSSRLGELSERLEALRAEFPESAAAKLEELAKLEREAAREAVRGQSAAARANRGLGPMGRRGRRKGPGAKKSGGPLSLLPRISNVALNLVGMLRPPGLGNLQGFVGYATSLLGLPLDLMLGVHNDGDAPEVMGEDREYPLLRVQPKIHFDVDF